MRPVTLLCLLPLLACGNAAPGAPDELGSGEDALRKSVLQPPKVCGRSGAYVRMGIVADLQAATGIGDGQGWSLELPFFSAGMGYGVEVVNAQGFARVETDNRFDGSAASNDPQGSQTWMVLDRKPSRVLFAAMTKVPEAVDGEMRTRTSPQGFVVCQRWSSLADAVSCRISNVVSMDVGAEICP